MVQTTTEIQKLRHVLDQRDRELAVLTEINSRLRKHFHLESLLKEIMNFTKAVLDSEACSLLLVDEQTEDLYFYVTDNEGTNLSEITLKKGQGIVGNVVETGEPVIVNDTAKDKRFFSGVDQKTGFVTRSLACVPMSVDNKAIGAVEVLNKMSGEYRDEELSLLENIASQSAIAIAYVQANQKKSLNDRMAVVGNMAASVIHDLRNSMQVISGFSQLIAMQHPVQSKNCSIIRNEIDKLVQMSQELLEFSRGSAITLFPVSVGLFEFVQSLFDLNSKTMKEENVDFVLELISDAELSLDRLKMQRVLQNILANAKDALEDRKKIILRAGVQDSYAWVEIEDSGKGMDADTLKNLFKPFFTKGKAHGTGLGMAIVENIVKGHGGEIQVRSVLGQGSSFRIRIPLKR